jgi:hypothetical protein
MTSRKVPPSGGQQRTDSDGTSEKSAFEARFHAAARRVLVRRGVAEDRIDAEIERLRRATPPFDFPSVEELERLLSERAERS